MRAYVLITVRSGEEMELLRMLRQVPGVVRADFTFGPYDVITELELPDLNSIGKLVSGTIRCEPGVIETVTCLVVA